MTETHKHGSEWHKKVAEDNLIWLVRTGSAMYGTHLEDSDIDLTGVCIEPPEVVCNMLGGTEFQQYQTQIPGMKIEPGGVDKTIFSLRKYIMLCAMGDPNSITMLYSNDKRLHTEFAADIQGERAMFTTKTAGLKFLKYADDTWDRYVVKDRVKVKPLRPELIEAHGYDTKGAHHALRIAHCGLQLMILGHIPLPFDTQLAGHLVDVRLGMYSLHDVSDELTCYKTALSQAIVDSKYPEHPNYNEVNEWVARLHLLYWDDNDLYADPTISPTVRLP